ncbi:MAG: hypothetical protein EOM66_10200 [Clostridia bacterium]|nr:hypothetical protein [Candidatus Pelethousia sp.]NCB31764.1 hypothetical protein [Clostridia bacterium]
MPSIIEKVSEAEAQAVSLRKEAGRQVREMDAAARQAALSRLEAAQEAGRALVAQAAAKAEEEGKHIAQEICEKEAAQSDARCQAARQALPQAVAYILERVKA